MGRPSKSSEPIRFAGQVGAIIQRQRLKKRLSVKEAAARAGVPAPTWYHWETGRHLPLDRLPAIAAALDCSPRALVPG
jgi:transcriptional regulator with XRE-family HTH domain